MTPTSLAVLVLATAGAFGCASIPEPKAEMAAADLALRTPPVGAAPRP
jgi:hypothetical protein